MSKEARSTQRGTILLGIAGGMLVVAAFGPGRLSVDARRLASA